MDEVLIAKQLKRIEDRQTEMFAQIAKIHLLVLVDVIAANPDIEMPEEMVEQLTGMIEGLDK